MLGQCKLNIGQTIFRWVINYSCLMKCGKNYHMRRRQHQSFESKLILYFFHVFPFFSIPGFFRILFILCSSYVTLILSTCRLYISLFSFIFSFIFTFPSWALRFGTSISPNTSVIQAQRRCSTSMRLHRKDLFIVWARSSSVHSDPLRYEPIFFTHLKLWLVVAKHNSKWVQI